MTNIESKRIISPAGPKQLSRVITADSMQTPPSRSKEQHEAEIRASILQHHSSLISFARYLTGNQDRANDLVQEAILRALLGADKFAPGTNFRGWIFTIARNLFYSERRAPFSKHSSVDDMIHEPATQPSQEKHLEFCEFRRAFWELRAEHRTALMQVGVEGLSYQAAATASACAVGTVKSRVSRARQDLRSMLSGRRLAVARPAIGPIVGGRLVEALQTAPRPATATRRTVSSLPQMMSGPAQLPAIASAAFAA